MVLWFIASKQQPELQQESSSASLQIVHYYRTHFYKFSGPRALYLRMESRGLFLVLIFAIAFQYSRAVTIGFTEVDYAADEKTGVAKVIVTVTDSPTDLNISLTIMSFDQFFSDPSNKLPAAFESDTRDPAEYSLDPSGRRDFVNIGIINVFFPASDMRQSREVEIPIVNDEYNEARESFVVVIDQNITIPEEVPEFLRDGIALITIVDNDPIELQFDRTVYTVHEAEGLDDEIISITKGGVVSEQVLDAVVQVVDLTPNSAELDDDFKSNKTYFLTFYPENDSLPFPVSIVDDGKVENLEQFGLVTSVVNSLASTGINSTARVVIVDSNDVVIGFENASYFILEGGSSDLCIAVKEPLNTQLDFLVPTLIVSQDGSAIENRDYAAIRTTVSATGRRCFEIVTLDNDIAEPNKNFTITLTFTPFGFSRTFDTDTPSITVEIVDDDDPCGNNDCHTNADCLSTPGIQGYQCVCKPGFIGDGRTCVDPCTSGLNDCDVNAECTTVSSAPGYQCTCRRGYLGNGRTCVAICSPESHDCHSDAFCIPNRNGRNYHCQCRIGFVGNGRECQNYCDANRHRCHVSADCIPTPGGYTCKCKKGFLGDGFKCDAICSPGTHDCHSRAYCIPSFDGQSYSCQCGIGMVGDGRQCDDYCKAGLHRCHSNADCTPTFGGYQCKCREGYTGDGFTCADADECQSGNKCHVNADCLNTEGGYLCTCKEGFVGNGLQCTRVPSPPEADDPLPTTEPAPPTTQPAPPTTQPAPPTTEPSVPPPPPLSCDPEISSRSSRSRSRSGTSTGTSTGTRTGRSWTSTGTSTGSRTGHSWTSTGTSTGTRKGRTGTRTGTGTGTHNDGRTGTRTGTGTGTHNDDDIARDDNGCVQLDASRSSRSSRSRSHSTRSRSHSTRSSTSRSSTNHSHSTRSSTSRSSTNHSHSTRSSTSRSSTNRSHSSRSTSRSTTNRSQSSSS